MLQSYNSSCLPAPGLCVGSGVWRWVGEPGWAGALHCTGTTHRPARPPDLTLGLGAEIPLQPPPALSCPSQVTWVSTSPHNTTYSDSVSTLGNDRTRGHGAAGQLGAEMLHLHLTASCREWKYLETMSSSTGYNIFYLHYLHYLYTSQLSQLLLSPSFMRYYLSFILFMRFRESGFTKRRSGFCLSKSPELNFFSFWLRKQPNKS